MVKTIKVVKLEQKVDKTLRGEFSKAITNPKDAADILREYIGNDDREAFVVMTLNTKNQVNCLHTVSIGSLNSCIVTPRETYKIAIETNAAAIIIGHNHPSHNCYPSKEDLAISKRLLDAGIILGIDLIDHIIVSDTDYISLKEHGHL